MPKEQGVPPEKYYTTGQTADKLRVSVSTLKRWIKESDGLIPTLHRNTNGWKLFSEEDLERLKTFQKDRKRKGRIYQEDTLKPVIK